MAIPKLKSSIEKLIIYILDEEMRDQTKVFKKELDRVVDRVKPWFMVHGLAHGS